MANHSGLLLIENLLCQTNGKAIVAEGSHIEQVPIEGSNVVRNVLTVWQYFHNNMNCILSNTNLSTT